jgi:ferric-dicitrate binding protein FerR (iron transport regulator)
MTTPRSLLEVTRLLRDSVAETESLGAIALPPGRDEAIARVATALRERARRGRRRRMVTALSLAAGLALVAGGGALAVRHASSPGGADAPSPGHLARLVDPTGDVTALREGRPAPSVGVLAEGTELRTTVSEASMAFASGTQVTLGSASRVRLVEQTARKRFSLQEGSLFAKVAKLKADERFVVTTSDAEIEVRGTAFRVSVVQADPACGGGTPTRLEVSEGVVVVRHEGAEVRVAAGERWPSCVAAPPVSPAAAPSASAEPARPASASLSAPSAPARVAGPSTGSSRLAEQNDLFDQAMREKRAGNPTGAMTLLERLLDGHPAGPLAESARVERMRLLASSDRAHAAAAARDYLGRHPHGFARDEAEALASGSR